MTRRMTKPSQSVVFHQHNGTASGVLVHSQEGVDAHSPSGAAGVILTVVCVFVIKVVHTFSAGFDKSGCGQPDQDPLRLGARPGKSSCSQTDYFHNPKSVPKDPRGATLASDLCSARQSGSAPWRCLGFVPGTFVRLFAPGRFALCPVSR